MNNDVVYGFLDESPALSDNVLFFCINILSTSNRPNKQLQNIVKRARKRIVKKSLKSLREIKFHASDKKTKYYILQEIAKQDVKIIAIIVDKENRKIKDSPLNYGIIVGFTIAKQLSIYPILNITMDKKFTNSEQETEFLRVVQKTVEIFAPKNKNVVFNPPVDSKKNVLIQLADFVVGALQAKYNNQDLRYAEIIKKNIVLEKIIKWTEVKKRIVTS